MAGAELIYYRSPWRYDTLFCIVLQFVVILVFVHYYRKSNARNRKLAFYTAVSSLSAGIGLLAHISFDMAGWGPGFAIYKDHFTCGHWFRGDHYIRNPWIAFTSIRKEVSRYRLFVFPEVVLRFDHKPEFADALEVNETNRKTGWSWCRISGLTDRRYGWPVDTDKIYSDVLTAWKAGQNQR